MVQQTSSTTEEFRKRQYANENGTYVLPNDAPEHDRLDAQSQVLITMMHNKPFHAPLSNPKRILDIGCGTGAMTYLLATAFPDAEVIGLDISPVPERYEKVHNLRYVQGDVMKLGNDGNSETDQLFQDGSFDYIFHRLLVLGMTNWPAYVERVARLLKPGGWTEMQDYDMSIFNRAGENISNDWEHWTAFREDSAALGLSTNIGSRLGSLMKDTGLQVVQEKMYDVPCVYSDDLPEHLKPAGRHLGGMMHVPGYARALMTRVMKGRRSEEDLERFIQQGNERYAAVKAGDHAKMGVAWGQKAG